MHLDLDEIHKLIGIPPLTITLDGVKYTLRSLEVAEVKRIGEPFTYGQLQEFLAKLFVGEGENRVPALLTDDLSKIEDAKALEAFEVKITMLLQAIYRYYVEEQAVEKKLDRSRMMIRERISSQVSAGQG